MAVYNNDEIWQRNPRSQTKLDYPIVEEKVRDAVIAKYGTKVLTDVYTYREVVGMDVTDTAMTLKMGMGEIQEAYEGYKMWKYIGYSKEPVIYVPPWNDVVHLVDEKQLSEEEQRRRMVERIQRIQRSPSPEVAKNVATILTAVDDVQDFCTTVGVGARLLGMTSKAAHIIGEGAFTTGELLNNMNASNKIPWEKFSPSEILDMVKKKKIDLDALTPSTLAAMKWELRKKYPEWDSLPLEKQKDFIQANYKMTRERWGMSLKDKKRAAEQYYGKGTPWGKLETQVNKRLARTLPTHGELLEIGQTSDTMAGVGLSLGPMIGLAMDGMFGAIKGSPIKFQEWTISSEELAAIKQWGYSLLNLPMETLNSMQYFGNLLIKTSYMIGAGEDLGVEDFLTATWTGAQSYINLRRKELSYAISNLTETIKNWIWSPGPKTSPVVREALLSQGINPYRQEGFPGVKLGPRATTVEIANAYLDVSQRAIKYYENKLSKTTNGQFLASCLDTLAFDTSCFFCVEGGAIHETFTNELRVYTRAIDYGLEPPIFATNEEFKNWHSYLMDQMEYFDANGPTYPLLVYAHMKFWPLELLLISL